MRTIPVVVPGIMGSTLEYEHLGQKGPLVLWSDDISANYERLIQHPGSLRWTGNRAKAQLIAAFGVSNPFPIFGTFTVKRAAVFEKTLSWIQQHPAFDSDSMLLFGYDWRAPLVDTSELLAQRLTWTTGDDVTTPWSPDKPKFCLIGHSMGGIVLMQSIGKGQIHPTRIDRIIVIGSPLKGAPSSFAAAYDSINLPFFTEIFGLVRRRNLALFYSHLLDCIRTFPSIYSLLPSSEIPYLYYGPSSRSNPLREDAMPIDHQRICFQSHELIEKAMRSLEIEGVDIYSVYTEVNSHRRTDLEYRVTPHGQGYGYSIQELISSTSRGDGTVPADSACGPPFLKKQTVINVDHPFLCNDRRVIESLTTLIPQEHLYAS